MPRSSRFHTRTITAVAAILLAGACEDAVMPTAPIEDPAPRPHVISCRADVAGSSIACQGLQGEPAPGLSLAVIVGGQGTYVQLASDNVSYDGSDLFQADVTVQNLIAQPMGTPDGTTVTGIKVFFESGPTVTGGDGTVSVANADGTGTFTEANQPYFTYDTLLQRDEVSEAKTWQWSVSPSVETFEFSVYVSTDIPVVPGEWIATPAPGFGSVEFTVNDQSSAITFIWFHFDNYTCGSATRSGSVGFGSTWPITDRQFTIDHSAGNDRFVFIGTFSALGDHATGTWELTFSGNVCSGTWEAVPKVNAPPTATVTSPADWESFTQGEVITFEGSGSDPEDGALTGASLVWESDLDGQIGMGTSFTRSDLGHVAIDWDANHTFREYGIIPELSAIEYDKDFDVMVGAHTISLTATDSEGASGADTVRIEVAGGLDTIEVRSVIAGTPDNPMFDETTSSFIVSEGEVHTVTERMHVTGFRSAQINEVCTYIYLFSDAAYATAVLAYRAYPDATFLQYYCPVTFAFAMPLEVTTATLDDGHETLAYSATLSAAGGTGTGYTWSVASGMLPSGMALGTQGGLDGTPTETGTFDFTARVEDDGGGAATRDLSLRICEAPISLGPGGTLVVSPTGPGGCDIFIPAGSNGENYRIAVSRPSESTSSSDILTATLHVNGVGVTPAPPAWVTAPPTPRRLPVPQSFLDALRVEDSTAALHWRIREQERRLLRDLGAALVVVPEVVFNIATPEAPTARSFKTSSSCSTAGTPSTGFLVAENAYVAVYQDSAQGLSDPVDGSAVQQVLDYYRDYGKAVIDDYFDGVSDVNGDGQIVVFVSPVVPSNAAAFVWAGNFVDSSGCAGSNEMELVFFNLAKMDAIASGDYQALTTLVHEAKHLSSLYNRLLYGAFHPSWIEEGGAEIARERSSRLAWAANGGPAIDARVTGSDFVSISAWNYGVLLNLARTVLHLSSQPNALTTNPDESPDHTYYGAGWHFHRLLGDTYGGAAFFRTQNALTTPAGTAAFPGLTGGKTFEDLLSEYGHAIMLNGTGAPQPSSSFTSYDFVSTCEIFSSPNPPGVYPWPVAEESFLSNTHSGRIGPSGLRIHDLTSNGTGLGAGVNLDMPAPGNLLIVRVQ